MTTLQAEALLTRAAHDLIHPWTEVITRDNGKWEATKPLDPLLTTLDELVASNGGAGTRGALAFTRNLVNLAAFRLREKITKYAREWEPATGVKIGSRLPLRAYIQHATTRAELLYQSGQLTEEFYTRITNDCERWKRDIQELIDPPREKEIHGTCPRCEIAFILTDADGDDVKAPALTIKYRQRQEPYASCGYCGALWQGGKELLQLAGLVGANTDYDTLKEMGMGE